MELRSAYLSVVLLALVLLATNAGAGYDHGPYAGSAGDSCRSCHPGYARGNTHLVNDLVGCEDCHPVVAGAPAVPGREICADCHGGGPQEQPHAAMLEIAHPATKARDDGSSFPLDTTSRLCLTCHDGSGLGPVAHFALAGGLQAAGGAHPIGMDYEQVTAYNRKYQAAASLAPEIVLMDGKMGCLSCHNLYIPSKQGLLAVDNSGSRLCFSCHNL